MYDLYVHSYDIIFYTNMYIVILILQIAYLLKVRLNDINLWGGGGGCMKVFWEGGMYIDIGIQIYICWFKYYNNDYWWWWFWNMLNFCLIG